MKKFKKILALALSLAMVLGMGVTSFAAGETPSANDKAPITVTDVEAGATVTAYRIVEPQYDEKNGFTGYASVVRNNQPLVADKLNPTPQEVGDIASKIGSLGLESVPLTASEADTAAYTAQVGAGYWIVLVTNTKSNQIYNPMLLGAYYTKSGSDNTMSDETISAEDSWSLNGTTGYPKKTKPEIEKKIVESGSGNEKGDDVAIGSEVKYQIESDIPTYSTEYTSVVYTITDTLSKGLTFGTKAEGSDTYITNTKVMCGDADLVAEGAAEVEIDGQTMTITVDSAYVLANGGKKITVTYSATLNEDASVNFDPNTNTATLSYTNSPDADADPATETSRTYHYTFAIDSSLNGESTETWNKVTEELLKTGETRVIENEDGTTTTTNALAGAEFTLTNDVTGRTYTEVSDEEGHLAFTGLDAGAYTLQETKAPDGYSLNDTKIPVEITADYNEDGTLKSYTIKVDDKNTSTYTATYQANEVTKETVITTITGDSDKHEIKNTKLSSLPSTGGIGTTIFTIGGCAIMILAAGLYFATRRRAAK